MQATVLLMFTQPARSKSAWASMASCGEKAESPPPPRRHSPGNATWVLVAFSTWKSEWTTRPHMSLAAVASPCGPELKLACWGIAHVWLLDGGLVAATQALPEQI